MKYLNMLFKVADSSGILRVKYIKNLIACYKKNNELGDLIKVSIKKQKFLRIKFKQKIFEAVILTLCV
jgi:ribosomal protein L14